MPESDPGDGEFGDDPFVIDFMRDLSNVGYDDAVVDIIGSGADVEHAEPSRDQELTDMLSAWRNDVDREPLNLDLPSDHTERGALPQAPTTGGTLSATEDAAAQIRGLASSENVPTRVLDEAYQRLNSFQGEIAGATGENSQHRSDLLGSVAQAQEAINNAIAACTKLLDDIHKAADGHARG